MRINHVLPINYHYPVDVAGVCVCVCVLRLPTTYTAAVNNDATNAAGFINPRADTLGRVRRCLAARSSLERSLRVIKLPRGETTGMYVGHKLGRKSLYRRCNQLRGKRNADAFPVAAQSVCHPILTSAVTGNKYSIYCNCSLLNLRGCRRPAAIAAKL